MARQKTAEMWLLLTPPLLMPPLLMLPQTPRISSNQHQHDSSMQELRPPYTDTLGGKMQHGTSSETKRLGTPMVLMMLMLTSAAPSEATIRPAC